jgi:hypothetical protein
MYKKTVAYQSCLQRGRVALFLSCVIHLFLFYVYLKEFKLKSLVKSTKSIAENEPLKNLPIELRWSEESLSSLQSHIKSSSKHSRQSSAGNSVSLKNLGVLGSISKPLQNGNEARKENREKDEAWGGQENAHSIATDPSYRLHRYIYDRINSQLLFPSELREAGLQGKVNSQIYFDSQGHYIRARSSFQSDNPYFKVLVIRVLRQALSEQLPRTVYRIKTSFELKCSFSFALTEQGNAELAETQRGMVGKSLFFYRNFHHTILAWNVGPFSGTGPTLGFNPVWLFQKGSEIFSKKAKIEPLQKYRDDPEW